MPDADIEARIAAGEDTHTEFKSGRHGLPRAESVAKSLCALANVRGGVLVYGVEDDGTVAGVGDRQQADELQRHIVNIARSKVSPPVHVDLRVHLVDGERVVAARVSGSGRPFQVNDGKYYLRDGPTTRVATPAELKRIFESTRDRHFDEEAVDGATRDDLDPALLASYLAMAAPSHDAAEHDHVLRAVKVLAGVTPTVTGILAFGRKPQRFLVDAYVSTLRVDGLSLGAPIADRKDLDGTLPHQLEATLAWLAVHVRDPLEVDASGRRRSPIPTRVWAELVKNALQHRDYRASSQTRVFVFDDRVEIRNPGVLLNELTVDGIVYGGVSQRRNPYLTQVLNRLGRAEAAGTGVPQVVSHLTEAGYPAPAFEVLQGEFRVTVRYGAT